jgi:hypothetical protein
MSAMDHVRAGTARAIRTLAVAGMEWRAKRADDWAPIAGDATITYQRGTGLYRDEERRAEFSEDSATLKVAAGGTALGVAFQVRAEGRTFDVTEATPGHGQTVYGLRLSRAVAGTAGPARGRS